MNTLMNTKFLISYTAVCLLSLTLSSCSVTPEDYKDESPVFDMADYFNGPLQAWGIFQDYTGKVVKRFHVKMVGTWQGNQGTLDEWFTYADGSTQRRTWQLTKLDGNHYSGTAGDVVGVATGVAHGNALRWRYTMALEVDDEVYHVKLDDWMYMVDNNTVINRSLMQKLGVTVGEVTLVFHRSDDMPEIASNSLSRNEALDQTLKSGTNGN